MPAGGSFVAEPLGTGGVWNLIIIPVKFKELTGLLPGDSCRKAHWPLDGERPPESCHLP